MKQEMLKKLHLYAEYIREHKAVKLSRFCLDFGISMGYAYSIVQLLKEAYQDITFEDGFLKVREGE